MLDELSIIEQIEGYGDDYFVGDEPVESANPKRAQVAKVLSKVAEKRNPPPSLKTTKDPAEAALAVRVDTEDTYGKFRLEDEYYASEMLGTNDPDLSLPEELDIVLEFANPKIPPHVASWRKGDTVHSSIRVLGTDGKARILTASTKLKPHVDQATEAAEEAGLSSVETIEIVPQLATLLGASSLIPTLAAAAKPVFASEELQRDAVPFTAYLYSAE